VLRHLRNIPDISSLQLGSIFPRFFPGIPADLPAEDINWFSHRGWKLDGRPTGMVYDLYMSLDPPPLPPPPPHPVLPGITVSPCRPEQFPSLITFIQQHFGSFPGWVEKYSSLRDTDDIADAILARRAEAGEGDSGAVVAAAVIYTPVGNSQISKDMPWARALGERVGGIGLVGVKSSDGEGGGGAMRGLLVAKAVEELRMRGCRGVFVDWVDEREVPGYAGVGFAVWGKYREIWSKV
jgi:beta-N-acetylhexosaminidase